MITFASDASYDFERIRNFLEQRNPRAASRAVLAIWRVLERVEQFPEMGPRIDETGIRQIRVFFGRRGYVVRYRILPSDNGILVLRIWHGREARR